MIFADRKDAGERLAKELERFKGRDPVVLALPRGGVPVAFEVAQALDAPLDLVLVRKIGAPLQPELAVAAVVDGEQTEIVTNEELVEELGLSQAWLREQAAREIEEIERRRRLYLADRERAAIEGKTAIVIDDGIATGATTRAALRAVRRRHPKHLVLAVPVAPAETVAALRADVDEVVCLATPFPFGAIGYFYTDFHQVGADEVRDLLARAGPPAGPCSRRGVNAPSTQDKVSFLSRCDAYPERPHAVERIGTHMSWVFLTDRHVYKLKKPVRWDSLDFSTLELRRHDCEEELRLNRRLTADVYLDVVPLTQGARGALALGGRGDPVDWLVHMRRLPGERMLDRMIGTGRIEEADVRPTALHLARFYVRAPAVERSSASYRKRLVEGTSADLRELCRREFQLPAERVQSLAAAQLDFLERRAALFDRRVGEGRIVEGHGDLRPEHVWLGEPPAIIDCLEFSSQLRWLDPADELAFLALECERLGRPIVGQWFFGAYREVTGDEPPRELVRFHRSYRALRRARISIWHLEAPGIRDAEKWRERALRYLELASELPA